MSVHMCVSVHMRVWFRRAQNTSDLAAPPPSHGARKRGRSFYSGGGGGGGAVFSDKQQQQEQQQNKERKPPTAQVPWTEAQSLLLKSLVEGRQLVTKTGANDWTNIAKQVGWSRERQGGRGTGKVASFKREERENGGGGGSSFAAAPR